MTRLALLLLLTSLILGCDKNSRQPSESSKELAEQSNSDSHSSEPAQKFSGNLSDQLAQIDDIHEVTFRHQIEKHGKRIYFLALFDIEKGMRKDPSDALMKRFVGHNPRVARESEGQSSDCEGIRDKKTGEQGVSLTIGAVRWVSDTEVQVDAGYYASGNGAERGTYILKKKDERWMVERFESKSISQTRPNKSWRTNRSEALLSLFNGRSLARWAHIKRSAETRIRINNH